MDLHLPDWEPLFSPWYFRWQVIYVAVIKLTYGVYTQYLKEVLTMWWWNLDHVGAIL